jgi:hypothetical protein
MRKILLIEDRATRQEQFFNQTQIELNSYSDILDNMINEKYNNIIQKLKENTFDFKEYEVIICHKSAFKDDNITILKNIEKYCKDTHKVFILFSGGIDGNYYLEEDNYIFMELNSQRLYSENIELFLEDFRNGNIHPLILSYGTKWKINILLNILEKINLILDSEPKESILYKRFKSNSNIELIEKLDIDIYQVALDGRKISKDEMKKLRDSILESIKKMSV